MTTTATIRLTVTVTRDEEGGFLAKCEELGLITCGDTLDEVHSMVQDMLIGHLEARAKHGSLRELLATLTQDPDFVQQGAMNLVTEMKISETQPLHLS